MKNLRLTKLQVSLLAASIALSSTAFAHNYKGEPANYKGEAMAAPCPPPKMLKDGFYVGAQLGYDSYRIRQSSTNGVVFTGLTSTSSTSAVLNSTGWVGGILGGYGQYFSNAWYAGAELFLNGSGATGSRTTTSTVDIAGVTYSVNAYNKTSVGASWGISFLPGYKLNDASLLYVRLGYNQARITNKQTVTATDSAGAFATGSSNKTRWEGGFNYGLGLETLLVDNLSGRIEYTHTNYNSFSNVGSSVNPSDNQGMISLLYHFA